MVDEAIKNKNKIENIIMSNEILEKFKDIVINNGKVIAARLNETYFININKLDIWLEWNEATKNLQNNYKRLSYRMLAADSSLELQMCEHCNSKPKIISFDEITNKRVLSKYCGVVCSAKSIDKVSKFKNTVLKKTKEEKKLTKLRKEKTMLDRYGYAYNLQRPEVREILTRNSQINAYGIEIYEKLNNYDWLYNEYWTKGKSALSISNELNMDSTSFRNMLRKMEVVKEFNRTYYINKSVAELEMYAFIQQSYPAAINSYRLSPMTKELDIYVDELKIGFEYNGAFYHNETKKKDTYHLDKMNYWNGKGVRVVQIWSDDWMFKKDIIKRMILNRLNVVKKTIHARKCYVKRINQKEYSEFLVKNHILGSDIPSVRLGLFNDETLVAVMGFKKIAKNIKARTGVDLSRFSTLDVHGSFSKLLSYYRKINPTVTINSMGDLEIMDRNDNIYLKNGFVFDYEIGVDYLYYDALTKTFDHKFNWRLAEFKEQGFDTTNTTEELLAIEFGLLKCYDSGKINYKLVQMIEEKE